MRKLNFALGALVLLSVFLSLQAQTTQRNTATVLGRIVLKGEPARNVLEESCKRHGVRLSLLQDLLDVQRQYA